MVYIHNGLLFSSEENEVRKFTDKWSELENILNEVTDSERQIMFSRIYEWIPASNMYVFL